MILDDSEFLEISKLVHSKGYNQNYKGFIKTLRFTRLPVLKRKELFMRGIQAGMLVSLNEFQKAQKEYNDQLLIAKTDKEKDLIKKNILIEKQWIRVLQTIADGIAWRAFNFDRPLLRHMSENKGPGTLEQKDYDYPAVLRKYLKNLAGFPIANDLTRILRIADFTVIYPNGKKMLYEIKDKGKKIFDVGQIFYEINKSKKIPNPQKWRHLNTQMSIIERKIRLTSKKEASIRNDFEAEIYDLDFPIKHYLKKLEKLIAIADRQGIASEMVEDGYLISVISVDKMLDKKVSEFVISSFKESYPDWVKGNPDVVSLSNYDSFWQAEGEFTRNIIPYSVLPLSSKNCVRMMMGHLWVTVIVDTSRIKEKLISLGWKVSNGEVFSDKIFEKMQSGEYNKQSISEKIQDEKFFSLERNDENGTFESSVSFNEIMMAISSFYSIEFIINSVEAQYQISKQTKKSGYVTHNYVGERKVLI